MMIWINGPFGVGKTQTAYELHARMPGSHVYDPEEIGFTLSRTFPKQLQTGDFQDLPLWRSFNHQVLKEFAQLSDQTILVPMTLAIPQYFQEIVGALREDGFEVGHFTLLASKQTILRRLRDRGDNTNSWPAQQLDRCLDALQSKEFVSHIQVDGMSISDVAETIAQQLGVNLGPRQNRLQTHVRRL